MIVLRKSPSSGGKNGKLYWCHVTTLLCAPALAPRKGNTTAGVNGAGMRVGWAPLFGFRPPQVQRVSSGSGRGCER